MSVLVLRKLMQNMLKLALGAVLATSLVAPAMAQDQFPDVPDNHWAYEALKNLKDKVLFGYPDGLYRGNRPLSRYEFAVAINQLHQLLAGRISGLEDQVKTLEGMIKGQDNSGMAGLRDQLGALTKRVDTLEGGHAELKKLVGEFEKELASLGVDVDALKKDVADLDARLKKLEAAKPSVLISGDVTLNILAGHSSSGLFGVTQDGPVVGIGKPGTAYAGQPVGVTRDLNVLHEVGLTLAGTNEEGPKWTGTFVVGNMFNNQLGGVGTFADNVNDIYVHNLQVTFDSAFLGQNFGATLGRVGARLGKYQFAKPDTSVDLEHSRYDDGKFYWDGGILNFNFGKASLTVLGGRNPIRTISQGALINPGLANVENTLGASLSLPVSDSFNLLAGYLIHDFTNVVATANGPANRLVTYGAEVSGKLSAFDVNASYYESDLTNNTTGRVTNDNAAYEIGLGYKTDRWGLNGAYRRVEENFGAPGDWGNWGLPLNPTGFKGFNFGGWFNVSNDLTLKAGYETAEGTTNVNAPLIRTTDDYVGYHIGLSYKLSDVTTFGLKYEDHTFKLAGLNDPVTRWYTADVKWNMSANAFIKFLYIYSDVDFKGTGFNNAVGLPLNRYKGGLIGTQLGIKF
jgi:uncharacterized protein (UPF0335 family)